MSEIIEKLLQHGGPIAWFAVVILCIFLGIGWGMTLYKSTAEIRSLKAQIADSVGDWLKTRQDRRNRYNEEVSRCGQLASQLRGMIQQKGAKESIDDTREAFCRALLDKTVPAFLDWVEVEHHDLELREANPDPYVELVSDAEDELRRFRNWLDIVNHQKLVSYLGRSPQVIQLRTLRPFLQVVDKFPETIRNVQKRKALVIVDQLIATPGNDAAEDS